MNDDAQSRFPAADDVRSSRLPCVQRDVAVALRSAPIRLTALLIGREDRFPTRSCLRLHMRRYLGRYVLDGAATFVDRTVLVHPDRFDQVHAVIASEEASKRWPA